MENVEYRELVKGDIIMILGLKRVVADDPITERGITKFLTAMLDGKVLGETHSFSTDYVGRWGHKSI